MEVHARLVKLNLLNERRCGRKLVSRLLLASVVLVENFLLQLLVDVFLLKLVLGLVVLVCFVGVKLYEYDVRLLSGFSACVRTRARVSYVCDIRKRATLRLR